MRPGLFISIIFVLAIIVSTAIYLYLLPEYIQKGGPLVVVLITISIMNITFIIERALTLRKARGKRSSVVFLKETMDAIRRSDLDRTIALCNAQRGTLANVLRSGIERFQQVSKENLTSDRQIAEVRRAIDEANALEMPLLERNLIALSTIASIATMVGLLGTTIGMIRSFAAMGKAGGAPDAIQLAIGISEALINTAGGLFAAIVGIVAYNYFVNRVDTFTYQIDEISQEMIAMLTGRAA
ncbi:MAG: MotA/TolQ/ExbB proton channel family protein [Candidatus Latescibacteria bacterium]|nr:MotA/TolQ/ExbB proton channel family protein [Candidatus Latescibacterota bacterium]